MIRLTDTSTGHFCWLDLAAIDAGLSLRFYARMFGWEAREHAANGGHVTRLVRAGQDVGSLYQLSRTQIRNGVPSHWTPYVRVDSLDAAARRAVAGGGRVLVESFPIAGFARIALVEDAVGALLGLWEPLACNTDREAHG